MAVNAAVRMRQVWGVGRTRLVARMMSSVSGNSSGSKNRTVLVSHILVKEPSVLDDLEAQLKAGASFKDLAQQHSQCQSARRGGELGWLERGTFFPEFEAAAFSAAVGGITRATTPRGHHLIRVDNEKEVAVIHQMHVTELQELLSNQELMQELQLVDVREPHEHDLASLPGFKLLPLSQFQAWGPGIKESLDPEKQTIVLCHHGVRSMQMSQFLVGQGFSDVHNVTGGIDAYSRGADRNVPLY